MFCREERWEGRGGTLQRTLNFRLEWFSRSDLISIKVVETDELLAFGPFRLDTRARLLLKDGVPVPLPPKSYDALVVLVRNRGRTVPREELAREVWPDVVVGDGSLSQAVFVLRKALGESEEGPRFIETVPRIGYRFWGEVEAVSTAPAGADEKAPERRPKGSRRLGTAAVVGAAAIALLSVAILAVRRQRLDTRAPGARLLSVVRELPVPPDATGLLGHVETSSLFSAPGAFYVVPDDGTPATRIPLREGETPVGVWDDALAIVSTKSVALRDPFRQEDRWTVRLPAAPGAEPVKSWAASLLTAGSRGGSS